MGRQRTTRFPEPRTTLFPWHIEEVDLCPANGGSVELERNLMVDGVAQKHVALHVLGQFDRRISLGLIAIRCERDGAAVIPLSLSIPETPPAEAFEPSRLAGRLQSNPQRHPFRDDADWRSDGDV